MDFRHLESFLKVAELKSFSRAAEALFVTQPTISGHIQALEADVGLPLFDRGGRQVRLTGAGQVFYDYAKKLLTLRREATEAIAHYAGLIIGELKIGGSTIPGEYILPAVIGRFKAKHPGVAVTLEIKDSLQITNDVLAGVVEIGVVGATYYGHRIEHTRVCADEITLVAARDHPVAKKDRVTLADLAGVDMLQREDGSGTRALIQQRLGALHRGFRDFRVVATLGSTAAVKEGVLAGAGVAFLSRRAVRHEVTLGLLKEIPVTGLKNLRRSFFAATARHRTLSPAGKAFLAELLEHPL